MKLYRSVAVLSFGLLIHSPILWAQTSGSTAEMQQLKSLVTSQQKSLEQQQAQIQTLHRELTEQQQMIIGVVQRNNGTTQYTPAVDRTVDLRIGDYNPQTPQEAPAPQEQAPEELSLQQQEEQQGELQRGPEIADPKPDTPALKLGPARVRILGYPAMTTLFRSTNSGGNVGTSFASIPFPNSWQGNTTEFRISQQSTSGSARRSFRGRHQCVRLL